MRTENLFATPIFVRCYSDSNDLNDNIWKDLNSVPHVNDVFEVPGDGVSTLKERIMMDVNTIAKTYNWQNKPQTVKGRFNSIKPGGSDTPHTHGAYLVGVYYLSVPKHSGDILLHDPRGYISWPELNFTPNDPLNRTSRCYHRVKPVEGMLILFPGFLAHSVETNLSNQNRVSIVFNVYN